MNLNEKIHALSLRHLHGSRKIAEIVLGSRTKKSTINDFFNRFDQGKETLSPDNVTEQEKPKAPRLLFIDVETAPIRASVWGLFKQNISLNMIKDDWFLLSYCAKFLGEDKIYYKDLRGEVLNEDDTTLLDDIWELLDQADLVIAHNGDRFDVKKMNARLILNGYDRPSFYRTKDTLKMAKESFGFTSNKLEYLTDKLCTKYKKSKHGKFSGFELWSECLKDNTDAWDEMEEYNTLDVLSLEELYLKLRSWDKKHPNMAAYYNDGKQRCNTCGSDAMIEIPDKFAYTNVSKFKTYKCGCCGSQKRGRTNMNSKEHTKEILMNI